MHPHHELNFVICGVVKLLQHSWMVVMLHTKRDMNVIVHKLAKFRRGMNGNKRLHFTAPAYVV